AAQLIAMKVASELRNNKNIVLHPKSHIAFDEENAYQALTGLKGITIGTDFEPFDCQSVISITEKAAALVVEMPLRRVGFKLTQWEQLQQMSDWAKQSNTHFHMDGARLWESTHFYDKTLAEISSLFDSVYVSLYKGLGGMNGSVLVGTSEFIEQCKVWRKRLGGNLWSAFPMLITALEGLDNNLSEIPSWVERAHEIADDLAKIKGITVNKPQTNGFLIFVEGDKQTLNDKAKQLTQEIGINLFFAFNNTANSNIQVAELQVGAGSVDITNKEISNYFEELLS
ncbi:Low-specificity L-threonine aldolase, partial [hydrothermal vent metagenome]